MNLRRLTLSALGLALMPLTTQGQWSMDPATNLSIADGSGDQVQVKLAPTPDGGVFVSWFDSIANGFDVRIQKLDAAGNELFAHNGVLVLDRGFSSTQDYGLDTDASGNALLAFRDDSGSSVQITAAKVTPSGTLPWGAAGVQLTATTAFVAAPKITGTADGGAVVAWTEDADAWLQKLDASGSAQWGPGVTLVPGSGSYSPSDLHAAGNDTILSFVHQTGGFGSPRHILAQKLDSSGALLWGAGHVAVFDGGSLQFGNFPTFVPDGSGGAVFSWYDASSSTLQCYAQRVLANGSEAFPHNGTSVSTNATRIRVSPDVAFNESTSETFVFWQEQNSTQSQSGVYGQKLDSGGARQWTDDGMVVVPLSGDSITQVRTLVSGLGAFAFWNRAPSFGSDELLAAKLGATGSLLLAPFSFATTPSGKSRLAAVRSSGGAQVLAWGDDRVDAGDILGQRINQDGTLGPSPPSVPAPGALMLGAVLLGLGARRIRRR